jgi:hypothetical protein
VAARRSPTVEDGNGDDVLVRIDLDDMEGLLAVGGADASPGRTDRRRSTVACAPARPRPHEVLEVGDKPRHVQRVVRSAPRLILEHGVRCDERARHSAIADAGAHDPADERPNRRIRRDPHTDRRAAAAKRACASPS